MPARRRRVNVDRQQRSFDSLYEQQKKARITKIYRAEVCSERPPIEGFPPFTSGDVSNGVIINSAFRPYGPHRAAVRPVAVNSKRGEKAAVYSTEVMPEGDETFICTIVNGFRHQIRAHLAWAGRPIQGDVLYGGDEAERFGLTAISLSFISPSDGKRLDITLS